jgi:hypothetical protein
MTEGDLEVGIEVDMAAGVPEEAATQGRDLVGELIDTALVGLAGVGGAGGYGAVSAFELPGELDGSGDEEAFDVVGRLEVGVPGVEARLEGVGVFAGEDGVLARKPCLRAFMRARSRPLSDLGPVDFCAFLRLDAARLADVSVAVIGDPRRGMGVVERASSRLGNRSVGVSGFAGLSEFPLYPDYRNFLGDTSLF